MVTFNSDKIFPYNKLLFENSMSIFLDGLPIKTHWPWTEYL